MTTSFDRDDATNESKVHLELTQEILTHAPWFAHGIADRRVRESAERTLANQESAIRKLLDGVGLSLDAIDRFEINEAFAAQVMGVERELKLDRSKLNVNGGAIAIGHPLAATGVRLAVTLARELQRSQKRYAIASACIGGGQGIAMLLENPN